MHDVKSNEQPTVDLKQYTTEAEPHAYLETLDRIAPEDADRFLNVGVDPHSACRSGTFIQKDSSVIHNSTCHAGVEILPISGALAKYEWLAEKYAWKSVDPNKDSFTAGAREIPHEGYFMRIHAGTKVAHPIQSCLYIAKNNFSQNVHNIVIVEAGADAHIITGCATAPHLTSGLHVGVSEFYIEKGATLNFTMVHDWGETVNVRPRTVTHVGQDATYISNYISLKPVGSLQMFPTTYLDGPGAVARFNSVLVAAEGCHLDVGSRVVLDAPRTRAEIISRAIAAGGQIIARGDLVGNHPEIKAHLECKGLILKNGLMHAVPELSGSVPGVEMSHEAAVGKIDRREIEYLMARGLDEDEAVSTIVRGFLNVDIEGLPPALREKLDQAIAETQEDMM
ncbi:MAG: SufD family Fe-S cluster assembly protein [Desulfosarcinaceae bacterium]|nr:SufD family Fe-S cluster assembly protein [Desulfosarcinaceae bacterium]